MDPSNSIIWIAFLLPLAAAVAIALFKRSRLRRGDRVVLEVLETNPGGKRFWQHAGFVPYAAVMECTA